MRKFKLNTLSVLPVFALLIAFFSFHEVTTASEDGRPQRGGAYHTGDYPDLFTSLLGKSKEEVQEKMEKSFEELFFGNDSTQRVYYPVGKDMGYIEDIANHDVRTEGMSYGMMIAVQMNRKDIFDRIWKWAKTYMQFKSGPHKGYFAWHCRPDGTVLDSNAASDGESWFAMSLFFASGRWSSDSTESDGLVEGNGKGIYNYREQAQDILNTMLHKEDEPGHGKVTDMFNRKKNGHFSVAGLVVFVPTLRADGFTDPSYQLPHYYELWARWSDKDNGFWSGAAAASRRLLKQAANPETGLCPDYCNFDGTTVSYWPGGHGDFRFDAWRVGMNVAVDYEWFRADEWEVTECNRLLNFFESRGIDTYGNQYTLTGKELGKDHSTGLVAMNAVAALASTNKNRKDFVKALWDARLPTGYYRYYDGMLYMLGLLQVSGNFRIYVPGGK
ncbi:MAG: glycosyl hydrolase family 8 [Bacteroidetes bacterium]|nr:glycosyl hydrolase family 8 [Bacteroidota bacterium]